MKVLVIGGTGVIGSFVVSELVRKKYEVHVLVRGIAQRGFLLSQDGISVLYGDRKDASFLEKLSQEGYDCVVDLACFNHQDAENAVNVFAHKITQYVFVSTVDVYTKPAKVYPICEEAECKPRLSFFYAWEKAQCEEVFFAACREDKFSVTIVRPAHTYSEGVTPLLQVFGWTTDHLDRLKKGKPIILHGDGNSLWSSCHAEDVAESIANTVLNRTSYGKAYNLASEEVMTWNQLCITVAEVMKVPAPLLIHVPVEVLTKVFPQRSLWCRENFQYPNIFCVEKAKKDLGFDPRINYCEGVERCIRWFDDNGGFEDSDSSNYFFYDQFLKEWESKIFALPTF